MKVTIKHGAGEALVRAAGLAAEIRKLYDVEVLDLLTEGTSLEVGIDGHFVTRRHGGPLEHSVGLGWPDSETVIAAIRERLSSQSATSTHEK